MQFKEKILANNTDLKPTTESMEIMIKLPSTCPQSFIVYGDEDPNYISNYKYMAKYLYKRYIRVGSELEINIDYLTRIKYKKKFEPNDNELSNDKQELFVLFDPCIDRMMALITASWTRFTDSKEYKMINSYNAPTDTKHKLSSAFKRMARNFSSTSQNDATEMIDVSVPNKMSINEGD